MKMKTTAIFLMFLMVLPLALSLESYPNVGGSEEDFRLGTGQWNANIDIGDYATYTKTLTNPKFMPLVDDLDNDGTNEIVVFDNNQIKIFRDNILTPVDTVILPTADVYSPPIIYDISSTNPNPAIITSLSASPSSDTYIIESNPTQNFGSSGTISADRQSGFIAHPLLKFDISSIPSNAIINSAQLRMQATTEAGAVYTMEAHRITSDWTENGATWNLMDGTNAWTSAGGDFNAAFTYSTANAADGGDLITNFTITQLVSEWVSGTYPNYGVIIDEQTTGASAVKTYLSRENLSSYAPRLIVNYTIPSSVGTPRKEIIVLGSTGSTNSIAASLINFNGTGTTTTNVTINDEASATSVYEAIVSCSAHNECIAIWSDALGASFRTRAKLFNSTGSKGAVIDVRSSTTDAGCFPLIPEVSSADADNDGSEEYIFSQIFISSTVGDSSNDMIKYFILDKNGSQASKQIETTVGTYNLVDTGIGATTCSLSTGLGAGEYPVGKFVSSPLVYNFDGAIGNGQEIVLAHSLTPTTYEMVSYQYTGSQIDTYPEIQTADGRILSNPMRMNAFPDTSSTDFCTLGFKQDDNILDLICASMLTGATPQTEEFMLSNSGLENYTSSYQNFNAITHSVSDASDLTDGNNLDEILMTYGTFSLIWDEDITPFNLLDGDNSLLTEWVNPLQGGTLLQIDAQGVGKDDIIGMTPTNLWYFDDGFVNENAAIDFYQVNPCIDRTWKLNTSVNIQLRAIDPEDNAIQYKAILYDGDANELDSGYTNYLASGTIASFSFIANKTIGTGTLLLLAHDSEHPLTNDEAAVSFSVATDGAELGDCTSIVNIEAAAADNGTDSILGTENLNVQDNAVRNVVDDFNGLFHLGALGTFLLLLLAANVWFLVEGRKELGLGDNLRYTFAIMSMVDILAIVVGAITLIIPFGLIVFLVIMGLLVLAFFVKDRLGGGTSGG